MRCLRESYGTVRTMNTPPVRLEVIEGNAAGMSILVEDTLVIGRHTDGAGRLAEDQELSRSHARIKRDSSGLYSIEDLESTNGTFVNGVRISGLQTLSAGDTIQLGATTLVVADWPAPAPAEDPAPKGLQPTVIPRPAGDLYVAADSPGATPPSAEEAKSPTPTPVVSAEPEPPTIGVRLEVDFAAREARIVLDGGSEPVLLRFQAGAWSPAAPSS
jgi:hypothetical protein